MTIILFFLVLFVLILVHEWGHFIAAKKTDMQVDEFGIGFPPKLVGYKKGETEYTFNALPIGGFVRIAGENAEEEETSERSFGAKSKLAQAIVLIAGVTMNVLFAWFLFIVVFMVGVPTPVAEEDATDNSVLTVTSVLPGSPAAEAGLLPGMEVTGVTRAGQPLADLTPTAFSNFTRAAETEIEFAVTDDGEGDRIFITPTKGLLPDAPEQPAVGISLALIETVSAGPLQAVKDATVTTVQSLGAIVVGLSGLLLDMVQGEADYSQVAGPVGIAGLVGDAAQFGFTSLLWFTAIISLNLAVINLLPFPALDGGRLVMVAIESVTRKPINPVWVGRVNLLGFILLLALMVAVTYSDILKLL